MRSVESKDLLERRWPGVGYALFEELGHRVLPPLGDRLPGEVGRRGFEVVRLEVAEDLVAVAEDGVVADAGAAERVEHLGPDLAVGGDVVVDPLRADTEDERASLCHVVSFATRTTSVRGP